MFKAFIKDTPFGISILLFALAVGFIVLIAPVGGNKALIVRSGSMQPTIGVGDLITAKPQQEYKVGDIVAFKDPLKSSVLVTHRIIGQEVQNGKIFFKTKGDGNENADFNLVSKENVIGRADISIKGVGKLLGFAKTNTGFGMVVIFPALLVIVFEIVNIFKEIKKQKAISGQQPSKNPETQLVAPMIDVLDFSPLQSRNKLRFKFPGLRVLLPLALSTLLVYNTFAFLFDTETSTGNVFQASEFFCEATTEGGPFYASEVVSSSQAKRKNGTNVLPERSNPNSTLGAPDGVGSPASGFFALGYGGNIVVSFDDPVANVPGVDFSFHEITNGRNSYPLEKAKVEVSVDGTAWFLLTPEASSEPGGDGVVFVDISSNGSAPENINFVKITDTTNAAINPDGNSDAYDVDAIDATSLCVPPPSPTPSPSPSPETQVNAGDVVINEINWGGSGGSTADEWIELKNTTSSPIDLTGWVVENLGSPDVTIPSGTILANGFFLISNFNSTSSSSKINISPDLVTAAISLLQEGEQLRLKSGTAALIDTANSTPGSWFAGENSTPGPAKSMERLDPPGDGTVLTNWQTASTHTNMDASGPTDEFATPKAENGI